MSDQDRRFLPDAPAEGEVITARFLEKLQDVAREPIYDVSDRPLELEEDPDATPVQESAQQAETETEALANEYWIEESRTEVTTRVYQNNDPESENWVDVADPRRITLVNAKTGQRRTDRYYP